MLDDFIIAFYPVPRVWFAMCSHNLQGPLCPKIPHGHFWSSQDRELPLNLNPDITSKTIALNFLFDTIKLFVGALPTEDIDRIQTEIANSSLPE